MLPATAERNNHVVLIDGVGKNFGVLVFHRAVNREPRVSKADRNAAAVGADVQTHSGSTQVGERACGPGVITFTAPVHRNLLGGSVRIIDVVDCYNQTVRAVRRSYDRTGIGNKGIRLIFPRGGGVEFVMQHESGGRCWVSIIRPIARVDFETSGSIRADVVLHRAICIDFHLVG